MKKSVFFYLLILPAWLFSQTPAALRYQAVVRDSNNNPIPHQGINLRISIIDSTINGSVLYTELHSVTSNAFGLYSLEIGRGQPLIGPISNIIEIPWSSGSKFLQIEMDATGGVNYQLYGTSELLSVPYALQAGKANIRFAYFSTESSTQVPQNVFLSKTWTEFTGSSLTVPESGTYQITGIGRVYNLAVGEWAKFRIFNVTQNNIIEVGWIGKGVNGSNGDQTGTINTIQQLNNGDVLRLEFYISSSQQSWPIGPAIGGNSDGFSSVSIILLN